MIFGLAQASSAISLKENIAIHKRFISQAASAGIELLLFPELSLTGYRPSILPNILHNNLELAIQELRSYALDLGVDVLLGLPCWGPNTSKPVIAHQLLGLEGFKHEKSLIHPDEEPFFSIGQANPMLEKNGYVFNVGICYESCQSEHWQTLKPAGILLCPVAKDQAGMVRSKRHWIEIAAEKQSLMLICNATGNLEGFHASGGSMVIAPSGEVRYQAGICSALIILDLVSGEPLETRCIRQ